MFFWILVAVLTAAVAAVLLLPLLRAGGRSNVDDTNDAEVYRDQLEELMRDEAAGLIGKAEAELARAEIARRLIAATAREGASRSGQHPATTRRRNLLAQALIIVVMPAVGLCLYLSAGHPELPAQPLAARLANPGNDVNILIAKAEAHLAENPDDGAGWDILAPIYYRNGRIEDSANAYREGIRVLGPSAARLDGYAEALIALSGGIVTKDAREVLQQSQALDAGNPRTRFYLALALEQEGRRDEALAAFEALAKDSPADAPWLPLVKRHVAGLSRGEQAKPPGNPDAGQVAAADEMTPDDRRQMIAGMVESLADRLKEDPHNFEGWMRIIRSYAVLDQRQAAEDALRTALKNFPPQSENGRQLLALADELAIKVEGSGQ
ncbi:cytochrome c-type biogenesis protein CcmH [Rhizobium subbaraonis]|uniref:Cytochrome c-type biogenesis protein CcmH n=1 Tax=Rhizobium subbaraonis TaxID=908946 RepID=A0A285UDY3_9HYPH|nr:c-type cytochrome biogenesis protein CcmI [Rhizobium subbaraonis]SOC40009.1 cytochrome c-type biogenesis protein CcmH [Rhizobium subbaraonis]